MGNVSKFEYYRVAKGKRRVWLWENGQEACISKGFYAFLAGKVFGLKNDCANFVRFRKFAVNCDSLKRTIAARHKNKPAAQAAGADPS